MECGVRCLEVPKKQKVYKLSNVGARVYRTLGAVVAQLCATESETVLGACRTFIAAEGTPAETADAGACAAEPAHARR